MLIRQALEIEQIMTLARLPRVRYFSMLPNRLPGQSWEKGKRVEPKLGAVYAKVPGEVARGLNQMVPRK